MPYHRSFFGTRKLWLSLGTTRAVWLSLAIVSLSAFRCSATPVTPYDFYMGPVFKVLAEIGPDSPDMDRVRKLMSEALSFEYRMEDPLRPVSPDETERKRTGDCKAKALWLAKQMNDPSVLYVIGRMRPDSPINHAWLQWKKGDRWYVLDATNRAEPVPEDQLEPGSYMPLYAFGKRGTLVYRAGASGRPSRGSLLAVSGLQP